MRVIYIGRGESSGDCACTRSMFMLGCPQHQFLFLQRKKTKKERLAESLNHLIYLKIINLQCHILTTFIIEAKH